MSVPSVTGSIKHATRLPRVIGVFIDSIRFARTTIPKHQPLEVVSRKPAIKRLRPLPEAIKPQNPSRGAAAQHPRTGSGNIGPRATHRSRRLCGPPQNPRARPAPMIQSGAHQAQADATTNHYCGRHHQTPSGHDSRLRNQPILRGPMLKCGSPESGRGKRPPPQQREITVATPQEPAILARSEMLALPQAKRTTATNPVVARSKRSGNLAPSYVRARRTSTRSPANCDGAQGQRPRPMISMHQAATATMINARSCATLPRRQANR